MAEAHGATAASAHCSSGHWQPLHQTDLRAGASGIWCLPLPEQGILNPGDFNREKVVASLFCPSFFPLNPQTGNDKNSSVITVTCGRNGDWTVGLSPNSGPCRGSKDLVASPWRQSCACLGWPGCSWLVPVCPVWRVSCPRATSCLDFGLWALVQGWVWTCSGSHFLAPPVVGKGGIAVSGTRTGTPRSRRVYPAEQLLEHSSEGLEPQGLNPS